MHALQLYMPRTGFRCVMCPDLLILMLYKLFAYLLDHLLELFLTYLVTHFLNLFISLTICPYYFQAGGHKRQPNLTLVVCVYIMFYYILLWIGCKERL